MLMCVILITLPAQLFAQTPVKPTITVTEPSATTDFVTNAQQVDLTCASTTAGVTYTFYKGTDLVTVGVTTGVLSIASFSAGDAGLYTCVATLGNDVAESLQLDVQDTTTAGGAVGATDPGTVDKPTLTMTTPAAGTAVTEGGQVELTCASGTTGVTYTFYKDASTSALTGVVGGVLTIPSYSATTQDGSYTCKAALTHLTLTESDALALQVGTAGGSVAGATTAGTTGENSAGHLKISLLMLPLGTLLATIVF